MTKYEIGERVTIKNQDELPLDITKEASFEDPRFISKGKYKLCGKTGTIVDRYESEAYGCTAYRVRFDGKSYSSKAVFTADFFVPATAYDASAHAFFIRIDSDGDRLEASLFDAQDGTNDALAKGTARILGNTYLDVLQAISFAVRNMYIHENGGTL